MRQHICGQQADTGPRSRDAERQPEPSRAGPEEPCATCCFIASMLIADGPFAETKEQIGGYDIIECAGLDQAIAVASRHPVARIGTIEVRPLQKRADDL